MSQSQSNRLERIKAALDRELEANKELRAIAEALLNTVQINQQKLEAIFNNLQQI